MISTVPVYISNLGNLFGMGDIDSWYLAIPFTVFCAVGIMNAFNMIDGINGLCLRDCNGCSAIHRFYIGINLSTPCLY